ncbi:MAG: DUF5063 domain-containing protein [Nocardioidaceae bacterium]
MSELTESTPGTAELGVQPAHESSELEDLAQGIADQAESFLLAVREIARSDDAGRAVPLLLLEVSQLLLAGARLGVQTDFVPAEKFEPDIGPDDDLDELRQRLGLLLADVDEFTEVFDPYVSPPELIQSSLSDDLSAIAQSVAHGLRHHRAGRADEALWWWQFSYVSSWGAEASAVLRALQSIVAHDRLDSTGEEVVTAAR